MSNTFHNWFNSLSNNSQYDYNKETTVTTLTIQEFTPLILSIEKNYGKNVITYILLGTCEDHDKWICMSPTGKDIFVIVPKEDTNKGQYDGQ